MIKLSKRTNFKSERFQSNVLLLKKFLNFMHLTFIRFAFQKSKRKTSIGRASIVMVKNYTTKITTIESYAVKHINSFTRDTRQWSNNARDKSRNCSRSWTRWVKRSKLRRHKRCVWPTCGISFTMKLRNFESSWQNAGTRVTTCDGKFTTNAGLISWTQIIIRFWTVRMPPMKTTCYWKNRWATCHGDLTR